LGAGAGDQKEQNIRTVMELLGGTQEDKDIPMIALDEDDGFSVVFSAKSSFIDPGCSEEDFVGEMTVFGKVSRILPANSTIDLIDLLGLLKSLPRRMRRARSIEDLKRTLLHGFEDLPESLGGPIDREEFTVHGPAIILSPVAVYTL